MKRYFCWYNNGSGWYEGPYLEQHPDYETAYKKNDIGYGAYISTTSEDPNVRKANHERVVLGSVPTQKA